MHALYERYHFKLTSNKFIGSVQEIFKNLPKPVKWLSFYLNDLPLLVDICKEVQDISIQHNLNKSQTRALAKLNFIIGVGAESAKCA